MANKKKTPIIVIAIIAGIALICGAAFAAFQFKNDEPVNSEATTIEAITEAQQGEEEGVTEAELTENEDAAEEAEDTTSEDVTKVVFIESSDSEEDEFIESGSSDDDFDAQYEKENKDDDFNYAVVTQPKKHTDKTAPKKAVIKIANVTCENVTLKLSKASEVDGFVIYASTTGKKYKKVAVTPESKIVLDAKLGNTMYYKAKAYKTVDGKKIYGEASSVVKAKITHQIIDEPAKPATCKEVGLSAGKACKTCGEAIVAQAVIQKLEHNYICNGSSSASCTSSGYTYYKCTACNQEYFETTSSATGHKYPTDATKYTVDGEKTLAICPSCNESFEIESFAINVEELKDAFDITGIVKYNPDSRKLTLAVDKIKSFTLSGTIENLTVSVDAIEEGEIVLNGLNITNDLTTSADDCIRINNKNTTGTAPTIDISAKKGSENSLKVTATGGNAVKSAVKTEFKGRGKLNLDAKSTAINVAAKVEIKNLTLDIKSGNRGIDTEIKEYNQAGLVVNEDYGNLEIGPNATITIEAADDGIRCKNMSFEPLEQPEDVGSTLEITSGADAVQLEGKTGLTMYSGTFTIKSGKYKLKKENAKTTVNPPAVFNK